MNSSETTFEQKDSLVILERDQSGGWAYGYPEGFPVMKGWFPLSFVKVLKKGEVSAQFKTIDDLLEDVSKHSS